MTTVSTAILDVLASAGAKHVFGIPGDAINDLVDAMRTHDQLEFVTVRHEEAGAFAAAAQAKLTGRIGVCVGTAGPGAIHLLNGLYDAKLDSAPVLAITGQVETKYLGSHYHQEVDQSSLFEDVAGFSETIVNVDQVPDIVAQAVRSSLQTGSVSHLSLPADLAGAEVDVDDATPYLYRESRTVPCEADLDEAAEVIADATNITILAGIGASSSVDELLETAELLGAPIIKTLRAKDIFPDDHPLTVGGLGLLGTRPASEAIGRTDLLLMVGTDFPYEDFYPDAARCIQIDVNGHHIGRRYPVDVGLVGHADLTLAALIGRLERRKDRSHLERAQEDMESWESVLQAAETDDDTPLRPQRVAAEIGAVAPSDSIFLADTGSVTVWAARHLRISRGGRFSLSSSLASMAYAMPAAIGAQLAFPDRSVVALAGDGGLSMLLGDFITAVTHELPITVVVFNNSKLGLIQMEQEAEGNPEYATALENPDFGEVARVLGGEGWRVERPEDLRPALENAVRSRRPSIVDVVVNPNEITMPPSIDPKFAVGYTVAKLKEMAGLGQRDAGIDPLRDLIPVVTDRI
jgi:thiamine pyrophosphate-dependent acetolactate synthase large subunit-like protein